MNAHFEKSFEALGGEFGNAVLTRGTILSAEVHTLPGMGEPRTVLDVTTAIDGRAVRFYVTHLASWNRFNRRSRMEQIDCLREIVSRSEVPFVVVGDFNTGSASPEMLRILNDQRFSATPQPPGGTHRLMREKLDYILPDGGWETRGNRVVFAGPSDHWPVVAELN